MALAEAKRELGAAARAVLAVTQTPLKELGDKSQVKRFCDGDVPNVMARAYARDKKTFIATLAKQSGVFAVTSILMEQP